MRVRSLAWPDQKKNGKKRFGHARLACTRVWLQLAVGRIVDMEMGLNQRYDKVS